MAACSAAKRPAALEATVTTVTIPGLGLPSGIFVLGDGTRVFSSGQTIIQLAPSGRLSTIAGNRGSGKHRDGEGISARFNDPFDLTVDRAGNVVVADWHNHAIRSVTKEGAVVSTLAGSRQENDEEDATVEAGFADGTGANACFNKPSFVVVAANGDIFVSDRNNHAIRVITPQGAVRTLCGNGQAGFADAQGADARFNVPFGLALDAEENLLVADFGNNAIRRVTMAGEVSTVAGNSAKGFADGAAAAACFNGPCDIVVDGEGVIVVADSNNHRLRKIVGEQVTTLAGSSEPGTADGAGAVARFNQPNRLALDERGRLLVLEHAGGRGRFDTLRVVEASLAPPLWMGPVEEAAEAAMPAKTQAKLAALENYGKLL
jgi:DNA-binding beta-propeller fold protein YncE